jgi:hypothetical protein
MDLVPHHWKTYGSVWMIGLLGGWVELHQNVNLENPSTFSNAPINV